MLWRRGNGQLDDVTLPKEANHEILPWFKPADTGINLIVAAALFHRNLIHSQNNISAENEFFPFDIRSQFSGMYSPAPGNRSFRHALNQHTRSLWQIERPRQIAVLQYQTRTFSALAAAAEPCLKLRRKPNPQSPQTCS